MTTEELATRITEQVKDAANARVVFGDPVTAAGATIIPVAAVRIAGGGSSGGRAGVLPLEGEEEAEGGMELGLKIITRPLGYIEMADGSAKLIPIADATKITLASLLVGGLALLTLGKLFAKRIR